METATATATASVRTPEAVTEAPTRIQQPGKPLSFTNGVLKRHTPLHHHHLDGPPVVVTYKECLKNHAATMGGHALDGCGEFMPSPTATSADPTSLKCAACGCHRNFHRRDPEEPIPLSTSPAHHVIEYQPHHRHHPLPPPGAVVGGHSSPNSASPPPISSAYPSAPHMLLALSAGLSGPPTENYPTGGSTAGTTAATTPNGRKRFRTKFTADQKERMQELAERVGWKMQKRDDDLISELCGEIGVDRGVFKVWMHNNKNTLGKKSDVTMNNNNNGTTISSIDNGLDNSTDHPIHYHHHHNDNGVSAHGHGVTTTNGSSSSS